MVEIKAFVAHSFSAEDKELIGIFLEHFDSLANSFPGFSWDHAQQAEPTSVSGKVLTKIDGKNVFIGICSRNEYVLPAKSLAKVPFLKLIRFYDHNIQWKTSDWIIQEIGLAVGRQMKVIIFLEEDVRKPGGLFGDIEYIPFSRINPQASFDRLLQMLGTFVPKETVISAAVADAKPETSEKSREAEGSEIFEPQPDWDQERYNRASFWALCIERDASAFEKIDAAFKASPFGKGIALTIWETRAEIHRLLADDKFDFEKIKKAARENPKISQLQSFLAVGYQEFGDYQTAARTFEEAAKNAETETDKLRYLLRAANQYAQAEQWDRSNEIIEDLKRKVAATPDGQRELLSTLRDLAESEKNDELEVAVTEQMVELNPGDASARFSLAFKHSQIGNNDMALYHYLKIPVSKRRPVTWNNVGVAYDEFGLRTKAVEAYRLSAEENETLAMANIGFKLLHLGFLHEAQQQADNAISIKPHHKNVADLVKRLSETEDEEAAKLNEILEKVKAKAAFYRKIGAGILATSPRNIAAKWNSQDGILEAKLNGATVQFSGVFERSNPFAGILSQMGAVSNKSIYRVKVEGQVRGNVILGHVKRTYEGETRSLAAANGDVKQ